jgi:HD superfamily phosphodiesterase
MKINDEIVTDAARFVINYLERHLMKKYYYHNLFHTISVVKTIKLLSSAIGITKEEKNILLVAAWFHDTGFTKQTFEHEKEGAQIADSFLKKQNVNSEAKALVIDCILATKMPQRPQSQLQQILCDADLLYLAETGMIQRSNLLRKEWETMLNKIYTDKEWYELNAQFLTAHAFHTQYCREQFNYGKLKNLKKITAEMEKLLNYTNTNIKNIAA